MPYPQRERAEEEGVSVLKKRVLWAQATWGITGTVHHIAYNRKKLTWSSPKFVVCCVYSVPNPSRHSFLYSPLTCFLLLLSHLPQLPFIYALTPSNLLPLYVCPPFLLFPFCLLLPAFSFIVLRIMKLTCAQLEPKLFPIIIMHGI